MNSARSSQALELFGQVVAYDVRRRCRQEHMLQFIVSAGELRTTEEEPIETVISDKDSGSPDGCGAWPPAAGSLHGADGLAEQLQRT